MDSVSQVGGTIFDGVWTLLTKTEFPGLGVSIAAVFVSVLLIRFSIRILGYLTGFGCSSADYGRASNHIDRLKHSQRNQVKTEEMIVQ